MAKIVSTGRLLFAVVAVALFAGACSSSTTISTVTISEQNDPQDAALVEFQASPAFLSQAVDRVEAMETHRFELFTEATISGGGLGRLTMGSRDQPVGFADVSGDSSKLIMDLEPMMASVIEMAELMGDDFPFTGDLGMTIITTPEEMFINVPFFAGLADQGGGVGVPGLDWLDTVSTGWGRLDLAELVDADQLFSQLSSMGGLQGGSGDQLLQVLREVGNVVDGGSATVRGVPTRVASARLSMADLIQTAGMDLESLVGPAGAELARELDALDVELEVYVDDLGLIRRIQYVMDLGELMGGGIDGGGFRTWQRVDFFDYGEAITIETPPGAVDITEDFLELIALGG